MLLLTFKDILFVKWTGKLQDTTLSIENELKIIKVITVIVKMDAMLQVLFWYQKITLFGCENTSEQIAITKGNQQKLYGM